MAERREERAKLEALTSATDDLRPSDDFTDAIMARVSGALDSGVTVDSATDESEEPFATLARATAELEPSAAMSDAIMVAVLSEKTLEALSPNARESVLERALRLTTDLEPSEGFAASVMAALPKLTSRRPWAEAVTRSSRSVLFFAAAVAAACVLFCTYTEQRLDADVVSSVDPLEVSE
jgi:hypothetical protein